VGAPGRRGAARAGSDDAEVVKGGTGFGARTLLRWLEAGAPVDAPVVVDR
jgi:leucyl aminopeptidase